MAKSKNYMEVYRAKGGGLSESRDELEERTARGTAEGSEQGTETESVKTDRELTLANIPKLDKPESLEDAIKAVREDTHKDNCVSRSLAAIARMMGYDAEPTSQGSTPDELLKTPSLAFSHNQSIPFDWDPDEKKTASSFVNEAVTALGEGAVVLIDFTVFTPAANKGGKRREGHALLARNNGGIVEYFETGFTGRSAATHGSSLSDLGWTELQYINRTQDLRVTRVDNEHFTPTGSRGVK